MIIETRSAKETIALGKRVGKLLQAGDVVALIGRLGSGKTTLTQGLARGLGVKKGDYVTSPSFALIKEHQGRLPLYHIDLYRINNLKDIYGLGYEEYFSGEGVTVIEWAERMKKLLPEEVLVIKLKVSDGEKRRIEFISKGKHSQSIIKKIKQER